MYRKRHKKMLRCILAIISAGLMASGAAIFAYPSYTEFRAARTSLSLASLLDEGIMKIREENAGRAKTQKKKLSAKALYDSAPRRVKPMLKNLKLAGLIEIPELKLRYPIAEGSARKDIRACIGHMDGSDWVDKHNGTCVLAGHRGGIYGEFFRNIDRLSRKSIVRVISLDGDSYTFAPYEKRVIASSDREEALKTIHSQTTLVLLSCSSSGTKRLIVRCRLIKTL